MSSKSFARQKLDRVDQTIKNIKKTKMPSEFQDHQSKRISFSKSRTGHNRWQVHIPSGGSVSSRHAFFITTVIDVFTADRIMSWGG